MFELCRQAVVSGDGCPTVWPDAVVRAIADGDHWFDGEGLPQLQTGADRPIKVMQHRWFHVEVFTDSVADERFDDRVPVFFCVVLDDPADLVEFAARLHCLDGQIHAFFGDGDQPAG